MKLKTKRLFVFLLLVLVVLASTGHSEKFLPGDPIRIDPDNITIPKPQEIEVARLHDFLTNTFTDPTGPVNGRAQNVNTLGEVPDSSWFTNRIGLHQMTINEVIKGPDRRNGPDLSQAWTILKAKTDGVQAGFVIRDSRGDVYFVKLDAVKTPELQSSAEIISTKFFYAIGYNVPENYIAYVRPDHLRIESKPAKEGQPPSITQEKLNLILAEYPRRNDGTIRVIASLKLEGEPLGGFRFYGVRSDDPNDIIPHENRRELRAYRIFSAWLNHSDSDSKNTLDMYVTEGNRKYIKHCLLDFGTTLGSGGKGLHNKRAGHEYRLEWSPIFQSLFTLGLWDRPWRDIDYPDYPAVGRFEANYFRPERWKPDHPNPAFERMQNEDAFWATRIAMYFTDEMIRSIVRTARITDPRAENYLAETLIRRRDKIVRYYLAQLNPLSDFTVTGETDSQLLTFRNLGVEAGLGQVQNYQYQWYRFDNVKGTKQPLGPVYSAKSNSLALPDSEFPYLMAQIRTVSPENKNWMKKIDVYVKIAKQRSVIGIEREN